MAIEIVRFPIQNGNFPLLCKRLLEGNHQLFPSLSEGNKCQQCSQTLVQEIVERYSPLPSGYVKIAIENGNL